MSVFTTNIITVFNNLAANAHKRVRFGLIDDSEPTNWSTWLISPADNWFEIHLYGPFPASRIRSCEIEVTVPLSVSEKATLLGEGFIESTNGLFLLSEELT